MCPSGGFEFGGQRYELPGEVVDARLNVDHTTAGYSLRLRFDAELAGPCMRCLEDAGHVVHVDAREVDQPGGGEDLRSPYLEEGRLDLRRGHATRSRSPFPRRSSAVRTAAGSAPCAVQNLNDDPEHAHEAEPDPRWAAAPRAEARLGPSYTGPLPMAVPKQRQSHSRTHKRRSQHKISPPGLRHCPRCHEPRLPHRVCPNCGTYAGREVVVQQPGTDDE